LRQQRAGFVDSLRRFSDEKPKHPQASSSELSPIGDNLPAKLIDFQASSKIEGEESHIATVNLGPGETLRAEAGAMLFMTHGIVMDTTLSGASSAFSRMMTGRKYAGFGWLVG
jgi:Mitochondrial biogenesis AIM24